MDTSYVRPVDKRKASAFPVYSASGRGFVSEHTGMALSQWLPTSQPESERQWCNLKHWDAGSKIELL